MIDSLQAALWKADVLEQIRNLQLKFNIVCILHIWSTLKGYFYPKVVLEI